MINIDDHCPYKDYYSQYVRDLDDSGLGLCPFHDDQNSKSFSVNFATGQWKCFASCGHGNIYSFEEKISGCSPEEAREKLHSAYVPGYREKSKSFSPNSDACKCPPPKPNPPKPKLKVVPLRKTIEEEVWNLFPPLSDEWIARLEKERGWTRDAINTLDIRLATHYFSKKHQRVVKSHNPDRVAIPIRDKKGDLINIRLYKPWDRKQGETKILSWAKGYGDNALMYHIIDPEKPVYIVEGDPDFVCAVSKEMNAAFMTAKPKDWDPEDLKVFSQRKVALAADADKAGEKFNVDAFRNLNATAASIIIVEWPSYMGRMENGEWPDNHGQDLTDFFVKHGGTVEQLEKSLFPPANRITDEEEAAENEDELCVCRIGSAYYSTGKDKSQGLKISNFRIKINRTYHTPDGIIRGVQLESNDSRSIEAEISPGNMVSKQNFSSWCYNQGNYQWKGSPKELEDVWDLELQTVDPRIIYRPAQIGFLPREKFWLFANTMVKDGQEFPQSEDGVFWLDKEGYQPLVIEADKAESDMLPIIRTDVSDAETDEVRKKMIRLLKQSLGGEKGQHGFNAYLILGYAAACVYSDEIFKKYKFPLLLISGKSQSGKNTVGEILVSHFGLSEKAAHNIEGTTVPGVKKLLSYYSNIPLWLDEYRSHIKKCSEKDTLLRSAYDRVGAPKSTMGNQHGIISLSYHAPLVLSGESFPNDAALQSRGVKVILSSNHRDDTHLKEIQSLLPEVSGLYLKWIKERNEETTARAFEKIEKWRDYLESKGVTSRSAKCYAIVAGAFEAIYNPEDLEGDFEEFERFLADKSREDQEESEDLSPVFEFIQDIDIMFEVGDLPVKKYVEEDGSGSPYIRVWLPGLYPEWQRFKHQRGNKPWDFGVIRRDLENEPYFVQKSKPARVGGATRRVYILDPSRASVEIAAILEKWREMSMRRDY